MRQQLQGNLPLGINACRMRCPAAAALQETPTLTPENHDVVGQDHPAHGAVPAVAEMSGHGVANVVDAHANKNTVDPQVRAW